ncbi:MAG: SAM-dependent methyltransferase [Nocardiopsaceae bacterium]|nr:SAM-dependent methyltransferase [Nocardiopsaceae bacterium]
MAADTGWVPPGTDTGKASSARVYDWWLGGDHNFLADRDAARAMIAVHPATRACARQNRAFLGRAIRYLAAEAGIRQFLDIGSGIPTARNVHQVAQEAAPGARVVYVDSDEVAVGHSRLLLEGNPDAAVVQADLRDPAAILEAHQTRRLIDFTRPAGLLLAAVLHFVPDADGPERILATLRGALAPGSYVVISHGCRDARPEIAAVAENVYGSRVSAQPALRTREQIARFFDGLTLVDPGLTWVAEWRPDDPADIPADASRDWGLAGVARYDG